MGNNILILEPGAWGTSLGILLSKNNKVRFWYGNKNLAARIRKFRENERLPGIKIPENIEVSDFLSRAIEKSDLIIVASPSFNFRKTLIPLKNFEKLPPLLGIAKGIEKETLKIPSQIVEEILGKIPYAHLSGPGFAREVSEGKSSQQVIAAQDKNLLIELKKLFKMRPLKILISQDLIGVQLAGALKNSLAIGVGLVEAKLGNPRMAGEKEALIKFALKEMIKLGGAMGAKKETFLGPAGLGDLILTTSNSLSRNFQFGRDLLLNAEKMRRGIKERKITVEGFDNTSALYKLGRIHKLDLPMINEIYKVIYKKTSPEKTIESLITLTQ